MSATTIYFAVFDMIQTLIANFELLAPSISTSIILFSIVMLRDATLERKKTVMWR
jgi:hypothetical protein